MNTLPLNRIATPGLEESCDILRARLVKRRPFMFCKYGDGAIECMHRLTYVGRRSANGEAVEEASAEIITRSWSQLVQYSRDHDVFMGDWMTASTFGPGDREKHEDEYLAMCAGADFTYLNYECLLATRTSEELRAFYMQLKRDTRKKLLVTGRLTAAAKCFGADLLKLPLPEEYNGGAAAAGQVVADEIAAMDHEIVIFAGGGLAAIAEAELAERGWADGRTLINIGSGLDPLFIGRTRSVHISEPRAQIYFAEFLA